MIKCIIFDLDNTLFDQVDYIKNLLDHIATRLSKKYNLDEKATTKLLLSYWMKKGPFYRHFFDDVLKKLSVDPAEVRPLIKISHSYKPNIKLYPGTEAVLRKLSKQYTLAIITDGNARVQRNKVNALGIKKYFSKIFYAKGENMKPNPVSYNTILKHFKLKPQEAVHVGDNPNVDFVTPNKIKMPTIRVMAGYFKNKKRGKKYEANYRIRSLQEITKVLGRLKRK